MYIWRENIKGDLAVETVNTALHPFENVAGFNIRPGFFRMG